MIRSVWILLMLAVLPVHVIAALPQAVPDAWRVGNQFYEAEEYDAAVKAYESVIDLGFTSPEVEYNLGNAHLKSGSVGRAILHYRRAARLDPAYENALANLDYARSLTQDVKPEENQGQFGWIRGIRLGPEVAAVGVLAAVTLFFLLAALRLRVWRDRLWATVLQGALGGVVLLAVTALVFEYSQTLSTGEGVLLVEEIDVHSGPGDSHTVNFRLHEGAEVQLLREAAGWRELKVSDGLQGWVPEDAVEGI